MKETQDVLVKMGFKNTHNNMWFADWFGYFVLHENATPEQLAEFIYNRGKNYGTKTPLKPWVAK